MQIIQKDCTELTFFERAHGSHNLSLRKRNLTCQASYDYSHHQGEIFLPNMILF